VPLASTIKCASLLDVLFVSKEKLANEFNSVYQIKSKVIRKKLSGLGLGRVVGLSISQTLHIKLVLCWPKCRLFDEQTQHLPSPCAQ
jgi:predicted KAP-like P-loop ATPase